MKDMLRVRHRLHGRKGRCGVAGRDAITVAHAPRPCNQNHPIVAREYAVNPPRLPRRRVVGSLPLETNRGPADWRERTSNPAGVVRPSVQRRAAQDAPCGGRPSMQSAQSFEMCGQAGSESRDPCGIYRIATQLATTTRLPMLTGLGRCGRSCVGVELALPITPARWLPASRNATFSSLLVRA
jgi:hypothetical protein